MFVNQTRRRSVENLRDVCIDRKAIFKYLSTSPLERETTINEDQMKRFLALLLLIGCTAKVESPRDEATTDPFFFTPEQLGAVKTDDGERNLSIEDESVFATVCARDAITFTFDKDGPSNTFACGNGFSGRLANVPLTIRFVADRGAKFGVDLYEECGGPRAILVISADREKATIRCPLTGKEIDERGDSAFLDYVID